MFTELYVAAFDEKALSMDESVGKLSAGAVVNPVTVVRDTSIWRRTAPASARANRSGG